MKIQSDLIIKRKRINYFMAVFISIALGLASRYYGGLPDIIVIHAGDTLWAIMGYFLFRLLFVHKGLHKAFFLSLVFCFFIEFSQFYQADWINSIRSTLLGALILGKGFLIVDLFRYSIGIVLAYLTDRLTINGLSMDH
ncbi:DUF2809 domain-containing protein [Psychrobacillus sp. NPDC096623]|uniref:ribosomal maturation YjgA family protein n=1 Tax=Psychrobacillus sp. NPDC096623 TaxID=3364492 RepID=UPI0037FD266D